MINRRKKRLTPKDRHRNQSRRNQREAKLVKLNEDAEKETIDRQMKQSKVQFSDESGGFLASIDLEYLNISTKAIVQ